MISTNSIAGPVSGLCASLMKKLDWAVQVSSKNHLGLAETLGDCRQLVHQIAGSAGAPAAGTLPDDAVLSYSLVRTTRRLTLDILWQDPDTIYMGEDDGPYFKFVASNGYEVISRSRMDIQTERIWLLGAKHKEEGRSGSMVFSSDEKRDAAYEQFILALNEWASSHGGVAIKQAPQ